MSRRDIFGKIKEGIFIKNPIFVLMLGLCPTLAVTTSLENALGMGFATIIVLFFSSLIVSLLRKLIPNNIRIPAFIVIIATFVTIVSMSMQAFYPPIYEGLGIYVPLIVVNCLVLGRALSIAYRNSPLPSVIDAIGVGIGFIVGLVLIGGFRELIGTGGILLFGNSLFNVGAGMGVMVLPPGALITIGLLMALFNFISLKKRETSKTETGGES